MPALDGYLRKRPQGRPTRRGWGDGYFLLRLDRELVEALEAYEPNPISKTKTIKALVEIGLHHVGGVM